MKNNTFSSGVTLIALIITIIILLILSAIFLNMVLGDSGIISKANLAKEKTNASQELESSNLNDLENKIDSYLTNSRNTSMQKELLFSNESGSSSGDLTLNKPYTNYSQLLIVGAFSNSSHDWSEKYVSKETLLHLQELYENNDPNNNILLLCEYGNCYISLKIINENTLNIFTRTGSSVIYYIYGIK